MKSKHRHELKTNELAEWLANLPNWFKENLNLIIYVSVGVVIIAAVAVYFWYTRTVQVAGQMIEFTGLISGVPQQKTRVITDQMRGGDSSYILLQTANQLELMAEQAKKDGAAALGFIKAGELFRTELLYRPRPVNAADRKQQINKAKRNYTRAIERSASIPALRASANYGLGLCEEELGNVDDAKKVYEKIINTEEFEGTTAAYQAKQRLAEMDHYQQRMVFQPQPTVPEPAVPETTTPDFISPELDIDFPPMSSPNE